MKTKNTLLSGLLTFALLACTSLAQAQTYSIGTTVIDVFAGGPNVSKVFVGGAASINEGSETLTGVLPIGLRAEYMVTEKFGIGLELSYASGKRIYDYTQNDTAFTITGEHSKMRVLPTFNFHFLDNETVDLYVALGVGLKDVSYVWSSTNNNDIDDLDFPTGKISSKLAIGTRIFFTDNIGANFAFGIGGPLVNGGLSIRI
ncbi:MAG: outer membrane beta-barrel protein [Bacteroidetes bacterium]|jgi:hypothetical protein|nr:outer membrane beta-barrel protein [Bacteroidota bacterium]